MNCVCILFLLGAAAQEPASGELHVGWSSRDITPDRPVALAGQFHKRISTGVASPLSVTALALETRDGDRTIDQAILMSCDLIAIRDHVQPALRKLLEGRLAGFDLRKLLLNATHTHTAPVTEPEKEFPDAGVMQPAEYNTFLLSRLAEAVIEAWDGRRRGGVNWGLGYAVVGSNRRAVYADGKAVMYGKTDRPDFRQIEGFEDHGIESLFFWGEDGKLSGVAVNVACPSQVVGSQRTVSADFWHDVREVLRARFSKDLHILPWTGAAGDIAPHPMFRREADRRMRRLQGNLSESREIALRIAGAVGGAHEAVKGQVNRRLPFSHSVEDLRLPARKVSEKEYREAKATYQTIASKLESQRSPSEVGQMAWYKRAVDRYENPVADYTMELHVLRLGDVAIATNPFELFVDYGVQIKARSRALQTFVIQLAGGAGSYLPTEQAVAAGGYSAVPQSNRVGPEGGRVLVDRTVEVINGLWRGGK